MDLKKLRIVLLTTYIVLFGDVLLAANSPRGKVVIGAKPVQALLLQRVPNNAHTLFFFSLRLGGTIL